MIYKEAKLGRTDKALFQLYSLGVVTARDEWVYGLNNKDLSRKASHLKADKHAGTIEIDAISTLNGIPAVAWDYKLGNRSGLEWVLDQWKECKIKDPTVAEKFNTSRFADHKEKVISLIARVCTVSVETMKIVRAMP